MAITTFHKSRKDLLREARSRRAMLRMETPALLAAIAEGYAEYAGALAKWRHRDVLHLRAAQLALLRIRAGKNARLAFLTAAGQITGETMRHSCYSPAFGFHFGQLVSLRRQNADWQTRRDADRRATAARRG